MVVILMMGRLSAMKGPLFFLGIAKNVPWGKLVRGWPVSRKMIISYVREKQLEKQRQLSRKLASIICYHFCKGAEMIVRCIYFVVLVSVESGSG